MTGDFCPDYVTRDGIGKSEARRCFQTMGIWLSDAELENSSRESEARKDLGERGARRCFQTMGIWLSDAGL